METNVEPIGGEILEKITQFKWGFDTIIKNMLDIFLVVDSNQNVRFVSPSLEEILGYSLKEMIGTNAFDLVYHEDRGWLMDSFKEVLRTDIRKTDEYRVVHKNGEVKYFESKVVHVLTDEDNLVVVSIRDITHRKHMEMELENRKNRYEGLQNSLKTYSNDLSEVKEVSELEKRLIKEIKLIIPNANPTIYKSESNKHSEYLTAGKLHYVEDHVLVLIGKREEMSYILSINASSIAEPMDAVWLETVVYYTIMVFESLQVIENLMTKVEKTLESRDRPQWIVRLLFNLSEKQRMELSSDLHDTVLQEQIHLLNNLETIRKENAFDQETQNQLIEIGYGMKDAINQIRTTTNELLPPFLREVGLVKALDHLFEHTQESSPFQIKFTTENTSSLSLDEETTIAIYRIVQELLNNAIKHSEASSLYVQMIYGADRMLQLEYTDDGKGFDMERLNPSYTNMGLSGIRERVRSLNGNIEFSSKPKSGLHVKLQIPTTVKAV
ncbi:PAS domain S-box protein [Fredinandcohnia humi]